MASVPSFSGMNAELVIFSVSCACPFGVSSMFETLPIGLPADLHLIAGDDLAGVDEDGPDLIAAAATEEDQDDGDDRDDDRGDRSNPPDHR